MRRLHVAPKHNRVNQILGLCCDHSPRTWSVNIDEPSPFVSSVNDLSLPSIILSSNACTLLGTSAMDAGGGGGGAGGGGVGRLSF